jgi:hypothetical protein
MALVYGPLHSDLAWGGIGGHVTFSRTTRGHVARGKQAKQSSQTWRQAAHRVLYTSIARQWAAHAQGTLHGWTNFPWRTELPHWQQFLGFQLRRWVLDVPLLWTWPLVWPPPATIWPNIGFRGQPNRLEIRYGTTVFNKARLTLVYVSAVPITTTRIAGLLVCHVWQAPNTWEHCTVLPAGTYNLTYVHMYTSALYQFTTHVASIVIPSP